MPAQSGPFPLSWWSKPSLSDWLGFKAWTTTRPKRTQLHPNAASARTELLSHRDDPSPLAPSPATCFLFFGVEPIVLKQRRNRSSDLVSGGGPVEPDGTRHAATSAVGEPGFHGVSSLHRTVEPKLEVNRAHGMTVRPTQWPEESQRLSRELHQSLCIGDRQWHQLKSNRDRRAAELLAAALTQLISNGVGADVEQLTRQALGWIDGELKDPGCPRH